MLMFAFAAALIAAAAAGFVLWRAARAVAQGPEAPEATVYARQIAELDEQKAQGLLDEDGWRAARGEAGRRLLGAAARSQAMPDDQGSRIDRWLVAGVAVGAVVLAGAVYLAVGDPGRPDEPFAARLAAWRRTPGAIGPEQMAAVLEAELKKRPNEPLLLMGLGQSYAQIGRYPQAAEAFEKLTKVHPDDPRAWGALGEVRMAESDGRIGPDARAAFDQSLKLDPESFAPLWWLGREDVLAGRTEAGLARWRTALGGLADNDQRRAEISRAIAQVEDGRFGQARAVAQAQPQQQAAMIRGMVAGLAERLERQGGPPSEWARLVRAYTVLGDAADRDRTLARARAAFAGRPQDLKLIESAATPAQTQP